MALLLWLVVSAWPAAFPLLDIQIEGNERLPSAGIVKLSGLLLGQAYEEADFQKAYERLGTVGLFRAAKYRFGPFEAEGKKGYQVVFTVEEAPAQALLADVAGYTDEEFWRKAKEANPLLRKEAPDNPQALAYYERELSRILSTPDSAVEIKGDVEVDLDTGKTTQVLLDARAPLIQGFVVTGNSLLKEEAIQNALRTAMGQRFTPRRTKEILDRNLELLYGNEALLGASWEIRELRKGAEGVVPVVSIQAGPEYKVRQVVVDLDGGRAPELERLAKLGTGDLAKLPLLTRALEEIRAPLYRDGYAGNQAEWEKKLDPSGGRVDLTAKLRRGKKYVLRRLVIEGADARREIRLRRLLRLEEGMPFNKLAIEDFLREASAAGLLEGTRGIEKASSIVAGQTGPEGAVQIDHVIRLKK
ncbi:MAG: hypothetical protein OHK0021_05710 [Bryobacter sp.]